MQAKSNLLKPARARNTADEGEAATAAPLQLDQWLPYRLFIVAGRVAEVLANFYGPRFGLAQAAWRIMTTVASRPGASAREIGQACALDQFAVSRGIAQLVSLGFARRKAAANDRRFAAVELSRRGHAVFGEIAELARALEGQLLQSLTDAERDALDQALKRLDAESARIVTGGWRELSRTGEDEG